MIVQTSTSTNLFGNTVTQTYILYNNSYYCHSDNGSEVLIFPAENSGGGYSISSHLEVLDSNLYNIISEIANRF